MVHMVHAAPSSSLNGFIIPPPHVLQQEYVLQADGSITPLSNTQNFVLSEKQAGEILAQVHTASKLD